MGAMQSAPKPRIFPLDQRLAPERAPALENLRRGTDRPNSPLPRTGRPKTPKMLGILLALALPVLLVVMANALVAPADRARFVGLLLIAYVARLAAFWISMNVEFFTNGGTSGDWVQYQVLGDMTAKMWNLRGFFYATKDDIIWIGHASLPVNIFALIFYLNGEVTMIGGAVIVVFFTCLNSLNAYSLAIECGADKEKAFRITAVMLFLPSFVLYTCHMYKDGMVIFFVFGALAAAIRLSKKFSVLQLLVAATCFVSLYLVRNYLLFVAAGPVLVGLVGLNGKAFGRTLLAIFALAIIGLAVAAASNIFNDLATEAQTTFEIGTSANVINSNARGGSGVQFDDGGNPWATLPLRIIITLFAPFPWEGGSLGFHIGKIDAGVTTFLAYKAFRGLPQLWRKDRTLVAIILLFVIPLTVAYALGLANVGLVLRQRMPIVFVFSFLAAIVWKSDEEWSAYASQIEADDEDEDSKAPENGGAPTVDDRVGQES